MDRKAWTFARLEFTLRVCSIPFPAPSNPRFRAGVFSSADGESENGSGAKVGHEVYRDRDDAREATSSAVTALRRAQRPHFFRLRNSVDASMPRMRAASSIVAACA